MRQNEKKTKNNTPRYKIPRKKAARIKKAIYVCICLIILYEQCVTQGQFLTAFIQSFHFPRPIVIQNKKSPVYPTIDQ